MIIERRKESPAPSTLDKVTHTPDLIALCCNDPSDRSRNRLSLLSKSTTTNYLPGAHRCPSVPRTSKTSPPKSANQWCDKNSHALTGEETPLALSSIVDSARGMYPIAPQKQVLN